MIAATPRLAVTAISWMTRTGMSAMATNPMASEASATEPGSSRRRKLARAAGDAAASFGLHGVHHLHPVAHPDGEDQKRHQDRHGVDAEAETGERAELPDNRHEGARQRHRREADRAGIGVYE